MRFHAVVFACCVLCGISCALGVDYFVATTGSDGNPGTEMLPWRTLCRWECTRPVEARTFRRRRIRWLRLSAPRGNDYR